jgi:hypothetical protein
VSFSLERSFVLTSKINFQTNLKTIDMSVFNLDVFLPLSGASSGRNQTLDRGMLRASFLPLSVKDDQIITIK